MFRGIDAVMNAVGPVLRKHGVFIVPERVEQAHRDVLTSTGKPSRECTLTATYRVYGPQGDSFPMEAPGEAMDFGDKGTPKAMSVAYRTVLLQALTIPTDDPEPDAQTYERAPEPVREARPPAAPMTETQRKRMFALLGEHGLSDKDKYLKLASWHTHRELGSTSEMSAEEAAGFIDYLAARPKPQPAVEPDGPNVPNGAVA